MLNQAAAIFAKGWRMSLRRQMTASLLLERECSGRASRKVTITRALLTVRSLLVVLVLAGALPAVTISASTLEVRVAASSDDAEERVSGRVSLTNIIN